MAPAEEAPRVRSASIGSMSSLLLQGWAMLADSCPACGVPLMRHPAGTVLLCVNCGRDTTTAADGGAAELAEPPAAAPAAPAGPAADAGPAGPATDLQSLPNGLGSSAVSSDSEEQGGEPVVAAAPPPLRERLRRAAGISSDPPADGSSGGQREDASKEIADLMLQGWAMLQEHCPRCLHPLLRSRTDRRIYCAACRMYAVYEGGAATAAAGSVAGQAAQQQQQQQPEAHQPQAGRGSVRQAAPAPAPAPAAPSAAPSILAASDGLVPSAPTLGRHLPAVDTAADAVAARLADATSALRAAPPGNAGTAVAAVQQCAAALQALAECHRALAALRC
ncbi:adenylate and guanylate cyclase catalytic domain-containing isoform B [Micractinium conductrix]|uniref:Adenylate and guanylate cyclase catalytic domain-containing isoform B n=1 Tax=Micractinium conductrix TaxID=554055 RepID=A0A2P6UZU5_9CHLO|nr:adenylate and guanylate cyclase catalytic domain-containing isoform B [Micractinium conductrix]|eukprot:PSC67343.1 adenylate and guanylate cyclase catalytic domain-containing isoform B [Micractinium conductrix]